MSTETYTISVYTENNLGLLNRISTIFLKRHINIESLTVSKSEIEEVSRFIIVVNVNKEQVEKIIGQIEKQIDVIKAYYHTNSECIYLQSALFKVRSSILFEQSQIQNIIKNSNAQIVTVNRDFFVIEKSGRKEEIEKLYDELSNFGIMQFVRSGRLTVTKSEMKISELLKSLN